jgi:hypothetical protein
MWPSDPLQDCEKNAQWKCELPPVDGDEIKKLKLEVKRLQDIIITQSGTLGVLKLRVERYEAALHDMQVVALQAREGTDK